MLLQFPVMSRIQVVRRPYVFIFRDERDPVERGLINLATAQIEYSEDQQAMVRVRNSFRCVAVLVVTFVEYLHAYTSCY